MTAHGPAVSTGAPLNEVTSDVHDRVAQMERLRSQRRAVKAAGRDEQRAGGVQVGIGRRLGILHVAVSPQERDQPVGPQRRLFCVQLQIASNRF